MKKLSYTILFFMIIVVFGIATLIMPKQTISEREQRTLNQFPKLLPQALASGLYQEQSEKALSDQFFLRNGFVQTQRKLLRLFGIRMINNVWITEDQLYQNSAGADSKMIAELSEVLNDFALKHKQLRFDFLLIPTANGIIKNSLFPSLYDTQRKDIHTLSEQLAEPYHTLDTLSVMDQHKDAYIYYKGDHHWTTLGAYTMFEAWQKQRGLNDKIEYEAISVNDAFYGTLANASGMDIKDRIEIYQPKQSDIKAMVTYVQEQKRTATIYDQTKQYGSNPYEIFLGGNFERIDIKTTAENERSLLLVKDSYANCFLPFLLAHYHKIIMIDPRFYYDALDEVIKEEQISDVMFLLNAYTLFHDSSLLNLMKQ